jgi:predicted permease
MKKWLSVVLSLLAVLAFFFGVWLIGRLINPSLDLDETALLRFVFVGIGLVIGLHGHRRCPFCRLLLPL